MEGQREAAAAENREQQRTRVWCTPSSGNAGAENDSSIHSLSKLNVSINLVTACTLDALSENATEKEGGGGGGADANVAAGILAPAPFPAQN